MIFQEKKLLNNKMCIRRHVKYPSFVTYFNKTWVFSAGFFFSKNAQISNFMKIRPVAAEMFHAGGRTDMTKLMVAFRKFANPPTKQRNVRKSKTYYRQGTSRN